MVQIAIVSGGLGQPSATRLLAAHIATAVETALADRNLTMGTSMIELRPLGRSIVDAMLTGFPSPELESAFRAITNAQGVIAVTPAFNASFSGLFKSFFDVLPEESLAEMPVLIAATGGTERHSLVLEHAMRPMFSYLHAIVSPIGVYAATDDFGTTQEGETGLSARIDKAARDFARLVQSCGPRSQRDESAGEVSEMRRLLTAGIPSSNGVVED